MNCSRALKLISLVIDKEATEYQKRLLDFHLMGCSSCRKALSMSGDISKLVHDLPAPVPPDDLEITIRNMIREKSDVQSPRHRFPGAFLAIPAVAALLILAITVIPISFGPDDISEPDRTELTSLISKNNPVPIPYKSAIRTAPLSAYFRQATLISF